MGGKARAKSLTPERRKEIAQAAAKSRWKDRPVPAHTSNDNEDIDAMLDDIYRSR